MAIKLGEAIEAANVASDLLQGAGGFVAGPTPSSPAAAAIQSTIRKGCENLASSPLRPVFEGIPGQKAIAGEICAPYWASEGIDPPSTELPFEGGQCQGVFYYVTADLTFRNLSTGVEGSTAQIRSAINQNRNVPGPVQGVFVLQQFPTQSRIIWRGNQNQGDMLNASNNAITFNPTQNEAIISNIQVSPLTPECGNPAPVTRPGVNIPPDNGPQFDFALDADGDIILNDELISTPFGDFLLSELVEGVLSQFGGQDIDPELLGNGAPEVAAPISQNGSQGEGGGDEDFGEPPEGRIWVGGLVEITGGDNLYGNIASSGPENTVYPRVVGNVSLKLEDDNSGIIRGDAKQIRSKWSEAVVDVTGLNVTGLRVSVLPEITYRVYPLSVIDKDSLSEGEGE